MPAAPPAPISVCASSMNRMIGVARGLHLVDHLACRRCSNSPFTLAPACSRPMSSVRTLTSLQRRRHVARGDAQREALDHRGLAHAGLAGEDRVVLPAPHQDVDDLADLRGRGRRSDRSCRRGPARVRSVAYVWPAPRSPPGRAVGASASSRKPVSRQRWFLDEPTAPPRSAR